MMLLTLIALLFVAYLAILVLVAVVSLKPPRVPRFISPGMLGLPQESVEVEAADGVRTRGWFIESPGSKRVAILVHGYLMNRCELSSLSLELHRRGISCLCPDLRAHGTSQAARVSFGLREKEDIQAWADWAVQHIPGVKLGLVGSSMGAVSGALAQADRPELFEVRVLDSPFLRFEEAIRGWWTFMGARRWRWLFFPLEVCTPLGLGFSPRQLSMEPAFRTTEHVKTLVLYGSGDPLINQSTMAALIAELGWESVVFPGASHCQGRFDEPERWTRAVVDYLDAHLPVPVASL